MWVNRPALWREETCSGKNVDVKDVKLMINDVLPPGAVQNEDQFHAFTMKSILILDIVSSPNFLLDLGWDLSWHRFVDKTTKNLLFKDENLIITTLKAAILVALLWEIPPTRNFPGRIFSS